MQDGFILRDQQRNRFAITYETAGRYSTTVFSAAPMTTRCMCSTHYQLVQPYALHGCADPHLFVQILHTLCHVQAEGKLLLLAEKRVWVLGLGKVETWPCSRTVRTCQRGDDGCGPAGRGRVRRVRTI